MGSVGLGTNASLGAFNNQTFSQGLDLGRCQIQSALGIYVADPANTFRAGMVVMRNSSGLVVPSDGSAVLGVAKWNHALTMLAVAVDEAIVLPGTTSVPLKHGTISNLKVALTAGGAPLTLTTDYTTSLTNGTVARAAGGAISDGATAYATYTFQLSEADLLTMQGKNFWNSNDEVSQNENRVTVITDAELLFTSQYDTAKAYGLTSNNKLYASVAKPGLFTSDSASSAKYVGDVFQVPTAADPFLGLRLVKGPTA